MLQFVNVIRYTVHAKFFARQFFEVSLHSGVACQSINQSINQRNFYSATYKKWTAALDNVNI